MQDRNHHDEHHSSPKPQPAWDGDAIYRSTMAKIDDAVAAAKFDCSDKVMNGFLFQMAQIINWLPPLWGMWGWLYARTAMYFTRKECQCLSDQRRIELLANDLRNEILERLTSA